MVVESCTLHMLVFEREAERLDQMKLASRIGAEANDIARIGRDLRTNKNYVKHAGD